MLEKHLKYESHSDVGQDYMQIVKVHKIITELGMSQEQERGAFPTARKQKKGRETLLIS